MNGLTGINNQNKKPFLLCILIIACFSLISSWINFQNREYDWDMPGYIGCYYTNIFPNQPEKIHKAVYDDIRKEATVAEYDKITQKNNPKNATFVFTKSPDYFVEQIPYYQIKVFYNIFVFLMIKIGFSTPISIFLPNIISYFLSGFLLFFIFLKIFRKRYFLATLFSIVVLILPAYSYLSSISTPDMLSIFFILLFFYAFLEARKILIFASLLLLVLTRPDFIILGVTYYIMLFFLDIAQQKRFNFYPLLFSAVLFAIYFIIVHYYHYPGWRHLFYDSFIQRRYSISKSEPVITIEQYLNIIFRNIINMKRIIVLSVASLVVSLIYGKGLKEKLFAVFIFGNIYLKYLFFPAAGEYRFFIGLCLIAVFWALFLFYRSVVLKAEGRNQEDLTT